MAAKELIQTITVGSGGASTIEFTSIPQDGTDLLLVMSLKGPTDSSAYTGRFTFNNDTSSSYVTRNLRGNGSSTSSQTESYYYGVQYSPASSIFMSHQIYVPNYAGSTNKSFSSDGVSENNATTSWQTITAGIWPQTSAITSIQIIGVGSFEQYSTASLYKFTKGSGGATVS